MLDMYVLRNRMVFIETLVTNPTKLVFELVLAIRTLIILVLSILLHQNAHVKL